MIEMQNVMMKSVIFIAKGTSTNDVANHMHINQGPVY